MSRDLSNEMSLLVADVFELAGSLRRHGEQFAGRVGQTQARWQLLSVLSDGAWTAPRAAQRLGVSRQAVQRVADDLDAEGLIQYATNPQHRRSPLLLLTPSGHDALAAITAAARRWQANVVRGLDHASLRQARATLREILDRINAVENNAERSP